MFSVMVDDGIIRDDDLSLFTPLIADVLGQHAALLIQNFHIELRTPTYVVDDVPWVERSNAQLAEQQQASPRTIRRVMKKLEDLNLVQSARMQEKRWNQTKSYTISYPHLYALLRDIYSDCVAWQELEEMSEKIEKAKRT